MARTTSHRHDRATDRHHQVSAAPAPDTLAIASFYKDWFARGEGLGNFMTYGDFPAKGSGDPSTFLVPSGVILGRDLTKIHPVDLGDPRHWWTDRPSADWRHPLAAR